MNKPIYIKQDGGEYILLNHLPGSPRAEIFNQTPKHWKENTPVPLKELHLDYQLCVSITSDDNSIWADCSEEQYWNTQEKFRRIFVHPIIFTPADANTSKRDARMPSITEQEFLSLGFYMNKRTMETSTGGTWYSEYKRPLNVRETSILTITWFCGTELYEVRLDTKSIHNIPLFKGSLSGKDDLIWLLDHIDIHREK